MSDHEIVDLVSDDDLKVIGSIDRKRLYEERRSNFRVINALIINDNNQIWVPRRHFSKKLFPGALDASVGGHVKSGESYLDAFIRESIEEINIDPRNVPFKFLMKLTPQKNDVSAFMHIYLISYNQEIFYNPSDFEAHYWLSSEEILQRIKNGDSAKSDLTKIITEYMSCQLPRPKGRGL